MSEPHIVLTRHARERMAKRNLDPRWVEAALHAPEWVAPDPSGLEILRFYRRIPELNGQALRVVAARDGETLRVLTAFPDRDATPPRSG